MISFIPVKPGDESTLGRLRQRCWATTYRGIYPDEMIDQFDYAWHAKRDLARITSPQFEVFFIAEDAAPIGYMTIQHGAPPLLYSLYLLPSHQHRGIGRMAFERMLDFCITNTQPRFLCHCQPENANALAFYRRMGGVIIARDEGNDEPFMNSVTFCFTLPKGGPMHHIVTLTDADVLGTSGLSAAKPRITARAIIMSPDNRCVLMHAAKYGIHTLPGGGVEEGETIEEALLREIAEETGCTIDFYEPLGYVEENRFHADYTQISYYYIVHTLDETLHPHLTALETANGTSAMWCTPDEAYERIAAPVFERPQGKFLQARDVAAMEAYFARKETL